MAEGPRRAKLRGVHRKGLRVLGVLLALGLAFKINPSEFPGGWFDKLHQSPAGGEGGAAAGGGPGGVPIFVPVASLGLH